MAAFQAHPIVDMRAGLTLAREPWRSPADTWRDLTNFYIRRGRMVARYGQTLLGGLYHRQQQDLAGTSGTTAISGSLTAKPVHPGETSPSQYRVRFWDGGATAPSGQIHYDDGLGFMHTAVAGESIGSSGSQTYVGVLANLPAPGEPVEFTDGTQTVTVINNVLSGDYDVSWWEALPSGQQFIDYTSTGAYLIRFASTTTGAVTADYGKKTGTIDYTTGAYSFTLGSNASNDLKVAYESDPGNPVMGIFDFQPETGGQLLIAMDTRRAFVYSASQKRFQDETAASANEAGSDTWSGDETNFFDFTAFGDYCFINNGVDAPYKIASDTTLSAAGTDFSGGHSGNDITAAKFTVRHRGRLIYFGTTEDTGSGDVEHPQRAHRSDVGAPETFTLSTQYADAPTNAIIQGGAVLGDDIVVFFDRGEALSYRYTGDPRAPYEWVKLSDTRGSEAGRSVVVAGNAVFALSGASVVVSDGIQVTDADHAIPDVTLNEVEQSLIAQANGVFYDALDQILWTVGSVGSTQTNYVLHVNRETGAWGVYDWPVSTFGTFLSTGELLWDDVEEVWNNLESGFDDRDATSGFPLLLAGSHDGRVYKCFVGQDDAGRQISYSAGTQRLNPYDGAETLCGFVDVVADRKDGGSLTLRHFRAWNPAEYLTNTIDLSGSSGLVFDEKVRRRVRVNQVAPLHEIQINAAGIPGVGIDAVIPYMKPAGPVRVT